MSAERIYLNTATLRITQAMDASRMLALFGRPGIRGRTEAMSATLAEMRVMLTEMDAEMREQDKGQEQDGNQQGGK